MSNQKNYSALQNVLPMVAGDIRVMKNSMVKLVNLQSGTSRDKAKNFFDREAQKESLLESKMGKMGGTSPTRSSGGSASGSGGTKLFSIADFIKNIANMLIKGALVALGTFGLAKLLQSDDVRKTIKDFISKMFFTVLEVIQKGAGLLTEFFKDNGPEIREAIVKTFQAVVKLLVTAIESTAELLSDKRVWEGLWEIIQAIYAGIKKVLSTKINVAGEEVSLGTILGAVIIAFGALKGSVWLLKQAADKAAASLFNIGGGKGGRGVPEMPERGGSQGGGDKGGSPSKQDKLERTRAGKEALDKITKARLAKEAADLAKSGIRAGGVLAFLGLAGSEITLAAANNLSEMNDEQLDMLSNSGGGDDTAIAAAITKASRTPTKTTAAANTTAPKQTSAKDPFNAAMVKGANKASAVAPGEMEKGLLDLIAEGESTSAGGYNAMNQGSIGKQILGSGNSEKVIGKKLTDMTVGEIMKRGEKKIGDGERVFAAGRYQIIPKTLKGLVTAGYISPNDKFDESTQDKLGMVLLQQRGLNRFKSGEISAEEFQNSLALEWGSIANTSGTTSLGGPNVAMKGSGSKLAALLGGKVTPATQIASATGQSVPAAEKSKTLIESMFDQLALFDEKILGGKLGIDSVEMQNALSGIGKEFMNNPTFIDNSNNVSSTNMPPALASAVGASTWDREIANYYVDRVTYLE
jgi:hypothetical protein